MSLDFSKCAIVQPSGEDLRELYRILQSLFPYDRPVYEEMLRGGQPFYTLISYAMYRDDEFAGHVGIIPMRIWLEGKLQDIIGIGAVATAPKFRRMGVSQRLMGRCIKAIDERHSPAVLFTDAPRVYESHGFNAIEQYYSACKIEGEIFTSKKHEYKLYDILSSADTEKMASIYAQRYPNYDGKVDRDDLYWGLYRMQFNPYSKIKVIFAYDRGHQRGYVRFEQEDDRLTITELCCGPDEVDVAESLLAAMWEYAEKYNIELCAFALPQKHFVWSLFAHKEIECRPEPGGVKREIFMARSAKGIGAEVPLAVQWSLADKF